MDLTTRLAIFASGSVVIVDTLKVHERYPILWAYKQICRNGTFVVSKLRYNTDREFFNFA